MMLNTKARDAMQKNGLAVNMTAETDSSLNVYPYSPLLPWNLDNYGPLFVPRSGSTITLTPETYALYERVIRVYEDNEFSMRGGRFFLNGREVKQYTFKNNYYWMMGDNRHDSQDSRLWGFVPEDHIVGKASLIWMSWGNGVRWSRIFKTIH
jgi:signal peptidase I